MHVPNKYNATNATSADGARAGSGPAPPRPEGQGRGWLPAAARPPGRSGFQAGLPALTSAPLRQSGGAVRPRPPPGKPEKSCSSGFPWWAGARPSRPPLPVAPTVGSGSLLAWGPGGERVGAAETPRRPRSPGRAQAAAPALAETTTGVTVTTQWPQRHRRRRAAGGPQPPAQKTAARGGGRTCAPARERRGRPSQARPALSRYLERGGARTKPTLRPRPFSPRPAAPLCCPDARPKRCRWAVSV